MKITLTQEEMHADFGNTYIELKKEYPCWSADLHDRGNILDETKLEQIFCRGLLLWYIRYCIKKHNLAIFNNIGSIYKSFYEVKELISFFEKTKLSIVDEKLRTLLKFDTYQEFMFCDKTDICESFSKYCEKHKLKEHIDILINEKKIYDNNTKNILKPIEKYIYSVLIETQIVRLGIVFQRWKIILEHMCSNIKNKNDEYLKNVYIIDKFLVAIQEMILLHIELFVKHIKQLFENSNQIINFDHNVIYRDVNHYNKIYNNVVSSNYFFIKIKNPELLNEQIIRTINELFN